MKTISILISALLVVVLGIVWASGQENNPGQPENISTPATSKLMFAEINKKTAKGTAILYDVRTLEEYDAGHFPDAINYPVQDLSAGQLPELAKDTPIYVYCRSGNRSAQAATILKEAGFTAVTDLGGIETVKAMGGKLDKEGGSL
jgi:rhodanese-related sulfurtransferase